MDNLIMAFDNKLGQANLRVVDDETYDLLYDIYKNQEIGNDGYDKMIDEFWRIFCKIDEKKNFRHILLQWNSHDHLETPIKFKRILQVLEY